MLTREKIDAYNQQINNIYKGLITTLTDSHGFWKQPTYFFSANELDPYLPKELGNIISQYIDWRHFNGVALYSIPLKHLYDSGRFVRGMILFGRADQGKFHMNVGGSVYRASGHFPLWMGAVQFQQFDILEPNQDTPFLIGLSVHHFPLQFQLYENFESFYFIWKKGKSHIVFETNEIDRTERLYSYCSRMGMLGQIWCGAPESDDEQQ